MSLALRARRPEFRISDQRGVATLLVTLVILVILTIIVLASTNVSLFEQRTATNENRQRLAEQGAEYAINLSGEYIKANRDRIISKTLGSDGVGGWLADTGASKHWLRCSTVVGMTATHPCKAEPVASRRDQLYYYCADASAAPACADTNIFAAAQAGAGSMASVPATAQTTFTSTTTVGALLCRLNTNSALPSPKCQAVDETSPGVPLVGNRIAVTLVGVTQLNSENATSIVKETWASYSTFTPTSAVPLVASGFVQGLGNAQIVAAPNAGGYGIPASIWSPNDVCIGGATCTGIGSVATCQRGEFLQNTPETELKTTCATVNNACGCPAITAVGTDFLSGHSGGTKKEGIDILDRDGGTGAVPDTTGVGPLPDITFYPGGGYDNPAVANDDSLFEWIFGVDYEADEASTNGATLMNCSPVANCAINALQNELQAQSVTCAALGALGAAAKGLYYVTDSPCTFPSQIGTPNDPAIVVVNDSATLNNTLFYGLLFVRSDNNTATMDGTGNSKVFGSVVVEGNVDIHGGFTLVYDDTSISNDPNTFPQSAKFARVPGSWLDERTGF